MRLESQALESRMIGNGPVRFGGGRMEKRCSRQINPGTSHTLASRLPYYQPDSPAESELIDRAVLAAIQMRRCARFQTAALARQIRNAVDQWDHQREEEIERFKALMEEDPDATVRGLQRTSEGCQWLLQRWERLEAKREKDGVWCGADRDEVIRLCGFRPERLKQCPEAFLIRRASYYPYRIPIKDRSPLGQ